MSQNPMVSSSKSRRLVSSLLPGDDFFGHFVIESLFVLSVSFFLFFFSLVLPISKAKVYIYNFKISTALEGSEPRLSCRERSVTASATYKRVFADVIVYIFAHYHTTYQIEALTVYMS